MSQPHLKSLLRAQVAQAVIHKFFDKPYKLGKRDCIQMAAYAIRKLGHPDPLAKVRHYDSKLSARKAMKLAGVSDFAAHIDSLGFERIGYASALPGDLVGFRGGPIDDPERETVALGVVIGNGRLIGFANPDGTVSKGAFANISDVATHAWRVPVLATIKSESPDPDEIFAERDAAIEASGLASETGGDE